MWFKKNSKAKHPAPSQHSSAEASLLQAIAAIPAPHWHEVTGGITAQSENGTMVELHCWRIGTADHADIEGQYKLLIDGQQVPVDGKKLAELYHSLAG
jgi:hypothetical protein